MQKSNCVVLTNIKLLGSVLHKICVGKHCILRNNPNMVKAECGNVAMWATCLLQEQPVVYVLYRGKCSKGKLEWAERRWNQHAYNSPFEDIFFYATHFHEKGHLDLIIEYSSSLYNKLYVEWEMFSPKTLLVGELKGQEEKGSGWETGPARLVSDLHRLGDWYSSPFLRHVVYLTLCLTTKEMSIYYFLLGTYCLLGISLC